jgi:hypothetical protein
LGLISRGDEAALTGEESAMLTNGKLVSKGQDVCHQEVTSI